MVLVFFILGIVLLILFAFIFCTVEIKVNKVTLSNLTNNRKLEYDYEICIQGILFHKVRVFRKYITKQKLEKWDVKRKLEKVDVKKIEKEMFPKIRHLGLFKKLHLELTNFHLKVDIGTEDVILTSGIIAIVSSLLGMLLAKVIHHYEEGKYEYTIMPVYQNTNVINLTLNCIIQVKMVHIIYCICILLKRRRVEKHERTSNRRSYDYGYE